MKKKYNVLRNQTNQIIGYRLFPYLEDEETVELTDEEFEQVMDEVIKKQRDSKS